MRNLINQLTLLSLLLCTSLNASAAIATFAGGCFWCMESDFDKVYGVTKTVSGYTGGTLDNPTYKQVSAGHTGHYEAVNVYYDPAKVSYTKLLNVFWRNIDPTDAEGQFCDKGSSYRAAIFYHNQEQRIAATASKSAVIKSACFKHVVTDILPASQFYPAEKYHQNYAKKNPLRYHFYRGRCGRDRQLKKLWTNCKLF